MNTYLDKFNTENEVEEEISRLFSLRNTIQRIINDIYRKKFLRPAYIIDSIPIEKEYSKYISPEMIIDLNIISKFGFTNQDKITPPKKGLKHYIYNKILEKLRDLNMNNYMDNSIFINVYILYTERIKTERALDKLLEENNLSKTNYIEEINDRIECLYKKYIDILTK